MLYRAAGVSAGIAAITLLIAGIALALFFGGAGSFWGPVNDVFISVTTIALILPMLAVDRMAGETVPWLRAVTVIGIVGAVVVAVGQLLLVAGVITLNDSFVTGGVGFLGIVIWMIALVVLAFGLGAIPTVIGGLAALSLAFMVATALIGFATTGAALWVVCAILLVALLAWLGSLSAGLIGRTPA